MFGYLFLLSWISRRYVILEDNLKMNLKLSRSLGGPSVGMMIVELEEGVGVCVSQGQEGPTSSHLLSPASPPARPFVP